MYRRNIKHKTQCPFEDLKRRLWSKIERMREYLEIKSAKTREKKQEAFCYTRKVSVHVLQELSKITLYNKGVCLLLHGQTCSVSGWSGVEWSECSVIFS